MKDASWWDGHFVFNKFLYTGNDLRPRDNLPKRQFRFLWIVKNSSKWKKKSLKLNIVGKGRFCGGDENF